MSALIKVAVSPPGDNELRFHVWITGNWPFEKKKKKMRCTDFWDEQRGRSQDGCRTDRQLKRHIWRASTQPPQLSRRGNPAPLRPVITLKLTLSQILLDISRNQFRLLVRPAESGNPPPMLNRLSADSISGFFFPPSPDKSPAILLIMSRTTISSLPCKEFRLKH